MGEPQDGRLSRIQFAQISQALRTVLKDNYYNNVEAFSAEGEAFIKLDKISSSAVVNGEQVQMKFIVRSYEGALADGFLLAWRTGSGSQPPQEPTYWGLWSWARQQEDVLFIPFDVKTMILARGADYKLSQLYNWTGPNGQVKLEQAQYAQFFVVMIEGIDDRMAIVPAQSWAVARDQHKGIEGIVHGFPLWIALALVADKHLETAMARIVQQALGESGWYKNPTTSTVLRGWPISTVEGAQVDPAMSAVENTSFAAVQDFWNEVRSLGGQVYFNPFAPLLVDFIVWFADTSFL